MQPHRLHLVYLLCSCGWVQTEDELHSTKKQAVIFQNKSKKLKTEVSQLKVGRWLRSHPLGAKGAGAGCDAVSVWFRLLWVM